MKRVGDSVSFSSTDIEQQFEQFFYRISIKSVRATLLLCMFLYIILYFIALPITHPIEQSLFWPIFLSVFFLLAGFFIVSFSSLYLNHPRIGNTVIAVGSTTGISISMFTVESLSPTLLYVTSLTMIACSVAFGLQWVRSVVVSVSYFCLNLFLVSQSSLPFADYTLPIFNLFGFLLIGIITGHMVSLLQINSFILKANGKALIARLKDNEQKYKDLSIKDGLTELFNRRHFDEVGPLKLQDAKRLNAQLHLFMLDIDYFKPFNDHYGHPAGDAVLISIATILKRTLRRSTDQVFRVGCEEFAVILSGVSTDDAHAIAE